MQYWEYLEVSIVTSLSGSGDKAVVKVDYVVVNGQPLKPTPTTTDRFQYLNQLGSQGWELVTRDSNNTFTFKRPKP
jgi:hypothetical protein